MAYMIRYSPQSRKRYPERRKKRTMKWGRWVALLIIFAAALWLRMNGIPDFLIPGNLEVTKSATGNMISALRDGAPMNEAVTAFCREIIDGATF